MTDLNEEKIKELELLHKAIFIENSEVLPELVARLKPFKSITSVDLLIEKLANEPGLDIDSQNSILTFIRELNSAEHLQNILVNVSKYLGTAISSKLLMVCWEGQFNCSPFLSLFTGFAVNGSYNDAIEVLSIVENLEEAPKDEEIVKSKMELIHSIKSQPESEKSKLLSLILESINLL
jgi:hypothetical protein